ncbi:MAG: dienelactone hydrolase family protein [Chloroflexota bacterium]
MLSAPPRPMILAMLLLRRCLCPSPRRSAGLLGILLAALVAVATPALWVAPASFYLLLADVPGAPAGPIAQLLGPPAIRHWRFAGAEGAVDADVYAPRSGGAHPTLLIVNGALSAGRKYAPLAQFGAALAQSGYTAIIPDYPDLLQEVLSPASLQDVEYTLQHLHTVPGVDGGRLEVVGFCVGATLGLLAAEAPRMPSLRGVVALSGYVSSLDMIQIITTGTYTQHGAIVQYAPDPWVVAAVARSLVKGLPDVADRAAFAPLLIDPPPDHYVAPDWTKAPVGHLSAGGQALLALLKNRDPARVAPLMAALPPPLPVQLAALSPLNGVAHLQTPVFIVADRQDAYIPNVESLKLQEAAPTLVHVTYVSLLAHVEPAIQGRGNPLATAWDVAGGAWQLFRAIDRTLAVLR